MVFNTFRVSTDASGEISSWNLNLTEHPNLLNAPGDQRVQIFTGFENQGSSHLRECTAAPCTTNQSSDVASVTFAQSGISGTWTQFTVGAPVSALAPLGIATLLSLLGFVGYRRLSGWPKHQTLTATAR